MEVQVSGEQKKIVEHDPLKHAVVLAVAGSGKSTTLVERMNYLFEMKGVLPSRMIVVMFNKSAALDMTKRLERRMGKRNAPISATYHRLGTLTLQILVKAGKVPAWKFDQSTSAASKFAMSVIKPFTENAKYPRMVADAFLGFVDRVKGDLADPYQVFENGEWSEKQNWFPAAYAVYERARKEAGLRFFSDLIYDPVMAVREDPSAAAIVANRYDHVIVDEYQDICESQQALIAAVAGQRARVMVVGDDDQTIYTWRGANPSYILRDFERDFVGATVYKLSRTWRYGHALSCAANYLIHNNKDRADKLCVSGKGTPKTNLHLVQGNPDSIIKSLRPLLTGDNPVPLEEIAVLVRAYSRSGQVQLELLRFGIPFRLEGGEKVAVLENPWVKMLIGWMNVGVGAIAGRPYAGEPDIGSIIQMKDVLFAPFLGLGWDDQNLLCKTVLSKPVDGEGFSFFANNYLKPQSAQFQNQKHAIAVMATHWRSVKGMNGLRGMTAYEFMKQMFSDFNFEQKIVGAYQRPEDSEMHLELVSSFLDYAKQRKESAKDFLQHVADLKSFDEVSKKAVAAVHITSIHRSKGLEWDHVFMVGLVQGKFPLAAKKKEDGLKAAIRLEDERRLFYVAMTRARKALYLMAPLDNGVEADKEAAADLTVDYVAPKEDGQLMICLKGGAAVAPYSLTEGVSDTPLPSQFLYESNIIFASWMSAFLTQGSLTLKSANPDLFNAYVEAVGSKKRVSKIRV